MIVDGYEFPDIERNKKETDEGYNIRVECCRESYQGCTNEKKRLAELSNTELITELKELVFKCGVCGYYEFTIDEVIHRLKYMI